MWVRVRVWSVPLLLVPSSVPILVPWSVPLSVPWLAPCVRVRVRRYMCKGRVRNRIRVWVWVRVGANGLMTKWPNGQLANGPKEARAREKRKEDTTLTRQE